MPGVSRTTIYRALETLVELGLARRTNHFEASARFDGNTDHHHHLVCRLLLEKKNKDNPTNYKLTRRNTVAILSTIHAYPNYEDSSSHLWQANYCQRSRSYYSLP